VSQPTVCVVGHPYGPLGYHRAARCSFASLRAAGLEPTIMDVSDDRTVVPAYARMFEPYATREFADFNLFHLNGDEIDGVLEELGGLPRGHRSAVYPMWELPRYPEAWAHQLERFDEVWAGSRFIADAIQPTVSVPVLHMPLGTEVAPHVTRSRRYYGISEPAYAFLFFCDLRSFVDRKNPLAVLEAFRLFLAQRPWAQATLVVKFHGSEHAPEVAGELNRRAAQLGPRVLLINQMMTEDDVHALIRTCDAFISLHRAEGYGLGLAEAMCLGRPVIGTGYSGNVDFMTPEVARLVDYRLVPVPEGAYPHWQDQLWAEPDVRHAAKLMVELFDDPDSGRALGRRARTHMQACFSYRATGLAYAERIEAAAGIPGNDPAAGSAGATRPGVGTGG
jgi:glycosyltransferase involved in cell wall biosynthesis